MFGFFLKRSSVRQENELEAVKNDILSRSLLRKRGVGAILTTSDDEDVFFRELIKQVQENKLNPYLLYIEPMSGGNFSVYYDSYAIGRVGCKKGVFSIQIIEGMYNVINLKGLSLDEGLNCISAWIKQIRYCLR